MSSGDLRPIRDKIACVYCKVRFPLLAEKIIFARHCNTTRIFMFCPALRLECPIKLQKHLKTLKKYPIKSTINFIIIA